MRELNEEQRIAVSHFAGPMLVLAGPGSGKTYTITERIKRLVNEHDVAPGNILVITFTKAAAAGIAALFGQREAKEVFNLEHFMRFSLRY